VQISPLLSPKSPERNQDSVNVGSVPVVKNNGDDEDVGGDWSFLSMPKKFTSSVSTSTKPHDEDDDVSLSYILGFW